MTAIDAGVAKALRGVLERVAAASLRRGPGPKVRVVAVSKTKPIKLLQDAYDAGHRVFGENYVQELVEKAPHMPADIQWHFVGHLQSNKVKAVLQGCPHLSMIETVDSVKLADKLNAAVAVMDRQQLNVMLQVNTSSEPSKYGVDPTEAVLLARHIHQECNHLRLRGMMTIGQPDYSSRPENFSHLVEVRNTVARALSMDPGILELSMGMSGDFEQAIEMGSTNVRIGSVIFGARDYSKK